MERKFEARNPALPLQLISVSPSNSLTVETGEPLLCPLLLRPLAWIATHPAVAAPRSFSASASCRTASDSGDLQPIETDNSEFLSQHESPPWQVLKISANGTIAL